MISIAAEIKKLDQKERDDRIRFLLTQVFDKYNRSKLYDGPIDHIEGWMENEKSTSK